jgi:hypothetical protein
MWQEEAFGNTSPQGDYLHQMAGELIDLTAGSWQGS